MLNPKEYRFMRTEILSYRELIRHNEEELGGAHSILASRYFDHEIKKYQKDGFIIEVVNMTTNVVSDYKVSSVMLYSTHLMLYMPI